MLIFLADINTASEKSNSGEKASPTIESYENHFGKENKSDTWFNLFTIQEGFSFNWGKNVRKEEEIKIIVQELPKRIIQKEDKAAIIEYIRSFDWNDTIAIQVATCESGLDPKALNLETRAKELGITKYSSYGIFQENRPYDERYFDWKYNIDVAYKEFYLKRGWKPWSCYNSGDYLLPKNQIYL